MRAIGNVKVKGYVLITDGNALRSLEHNTISNDYISYLSSILLGEVPPATNVILVTQPNNVVYNPQKVTFSVVATPRLYRLLTLLLNSLLHFLFTLLTVRVQFLFQLTHLAYLSLSLVRSLLCGQYSMM
ncbi:hypothetical protein [Metallosphaera sp.]|uniref:hypothetical protein n=1 Tax=Metallosphaera sp. TaxID=2020860 RepID=UPI0031682568